MNILNPLYTEFGTSGNFIYEGEEIPYNTMNGLYIVKYGGKTEKVWVVK